MSASPWEFWIDVGGTFTDCLAQSPSGELRRHKLLSSGTTKGSVGAESSSSCIVDSLRRGDPPDFWTDFRFTLLDDSGISIGESTIEKFDASTGSLHLREALPRAPLSGANYELTCDFEAPVLGIRYLLSLPLQSVVPPIRLRLGTTRGTNALLTRNGARTALVTTRGFGDMLEIGYQDRPQLFDLTVRKSPPLAEITIEVEERVDAQGNVLIAPQADVVRAQLTQLRNAGIEAIAICLLHSDLYPEHEQLISRLAAEVGFTQVSCSFEIASLVKVVARAETTVVDAYLTPVLRDYLVQLQASLPNSQIRLMTSAGGLVSAESFRGFQSVLSGPAGGVVGYSQVAQAAGFQRAIGFDMGGTSTDVSRFDGKFEFEYETRKAGVRLMSPTLAIDTVAAGGGSLCKFDGTKLTVGPESAGADPGPACYGRGGPLCITDLNLYLGRIAVDRFPFALDRKAVERCLVSLADEVVIGTGERLSPVQLAEGLLQIANANMSRAIRAISISKGADPADYVMISFGGAAAQHACAVARDLGIRQVLNHPDAGILSAFGIGRADIVKHAAVGIAKLTTEIDHSELKELFEQLKKESICEILADGIATEQISTLRTLDMRYQGTDASLSVEFTEAVDFVAEFSQSHRLRYGYAQPERPVEIIAARIELTGSTNRKSLKTQRCSNSSRIDSLQKVTGYFDGRETSVPLFDRGNIQAGNVIAGPAIISDVHSTIVVEQGWLAEKLTGGELLLTDQGAGQSQTESSQTVMLEVFNHLFAGIAEQMGHVLRRTACSVNVKERLDYSCAIFTAQGDLIANAPHVPVHLGAMGATVRAILADNPELFPGDVFVTNDPYRGGSHLPDITVVTPVHSEKSGNLEFFTACRAHHAEIGGVRPGSMPPNSRSLADEGVLISNFAFVRNGVSRENELQKILAGGKHPSRRVNENLADIRAQVAANQHGASNLLELIARHSRVKVQSNMQGIQAAAEKKVRQALAKIGDRKCSFTDYLETAEGESIPIQVALTLQTDKNKPAAVIDFTGTGPVVDGNLNANRAIVTAAVLYVLRLLVDEEVPLNEGSLKAVEIVLPTSVLNPPVGETLETTPAVAAGNVETSQRVVDVLLGAFGVAGASQGTMNNLLFGNDSFGYYETICGGSGATADGPGADAVQVHMTNTRATDPEILERRHPVRLLEFSIRRNSGGAGQHQGGAGVTRRLEFLQPLELSLITQRRGKHPPYGMAGGKPGSCGENQLIHTNGTLESLPAICQRSVTAGDVLVVNTPGGGGYGIPPSDR